MDTVFLPLAPGRVHHWGGAGLLVAHRPDLTHLPLCLSPAEQRVARALPAWRRSEWMAGRLLAKRLAGELLGAPAREVEVLPRDDGSPQLLVGGLPLPRVHVSISHTPATPPQRWRGGRWAWTCARRPPPPPCAGSRTTPSPRGSSP